MDSDDDDFVPASVQFGKRKAAPLPPGSAAAANRSQKRKGSVSGIAASLTPAPSPAAKGPAQHAQQLQWKPCNAQNRQPLAQLVQNTVNISRKDVVGPAKPSGRLSLGKLASASTTPGLSRTPSGPHTAPNRGHAAATATPVPASAQQQQPGNSCAALAARPAPAPAPASMPRAATDCPCPICGCNLRQVSDTEAGRQAHVNACLDAMACGGPAAATAALIPAPVQAPAQMAQSVQRQSFPIEEAIVLDDDSDEEEAGCHHGVAAQVQAKPGQQQPLLHALPAPTAAAAASGPGRMDQHQQHNHHHQQQQHDHCQQQHAAAGNVGGAGDEGGGDGGEDDGWEAWDLGELPLSLAPPRLAAPPASSPRAHTSQLAPPPAKASADDASWQAAAGGAAALASYRTWQPQPPQPPPQQQRQQHGPPQLQEGQEGLEGQELGLGGGGGDEGGWGGGGGDEGKWGGDFPATLDPWAECDEAPCGAAAAEEEEQDEEQEQEEGEEGEQEDVDEGEQGEEEDCDLGQLGQGDPPQNDDAGDGWWDGAEREEEGVSHEEPYCGDDEYEHDLGGGACMPQQQGGTDRDAQQQQQQQQQQQEQQRQHGVRQMDDGDVLCLDMDDDADGDVCMVEPPVQLHHHYHLHQERHLQHPQLPHQHQHHPQHQQQQQAGALSWPLVDIWLASHGFQRYVRAFAAAEVDEDTLPLLTRADLQEIGVASPVDQDALLAAAALAPDDMPSLKKRLPPQHQHHQPQQQQQRPCTAAAHAPPPPPAATCPAAPPAAATAAAAAASAPAAQPQPPTAAFNPIAASMFAASRNPSTTRITSYFGSTATHANAANTSSGSAGQGAQQHMQHLHHQQHQGQRHHLQGQGQQQLDERAASHGAAGPSGRGGCVNGGNGVNGSGSGMFGAVGGLPLAPAAAAAAAGRGMGDGRHQQQRGALGGARGGGRGRGGAASAGMGAGAGANGSAAAAAAGGGRGMGGGASYSAGIPNWVAKAHTIPGTRFLVDFFCPASRSIKGIPYWILTHFHADHYKGLTKGWSQGTVLASPVTAALVQSQIRLPAARLREVPWDTPTVIDGVTLTFVDANHCPGAAMVIAEVPGCPPVLHTGDCRLVERMQSHPALAALKGRGATLVLDTTYCNPQYSFPSQEDVVRQVVQAVVAERFNKRALFVFGTYTIGKERVFLEAAKALGQQVYVSRDKARILADIGLAPDYKALVTTDHMATCVHAVPMFKVNMDGLASILHHYKGRYNTIVGVQPTGWTQPGAASAKQRGSGTCGRRMQKGTLVLYQVPYSEHSSYAELRAFVAWLQPGAIIPSVNDDNGGPKTKALVALLTGPEPTPPPPGAKAGPRGSLPGPAPAKGGQDIRKMFGGGGAGGAGR